MTMPAGWKSTNEQAALGKEETLWRNHVTKDIFKKGSGGSYNNQLQSITKR